MIFNISEILSKDNVALHLLDEKTIEPLTKLAADLRIWQYIPETFQEPTVFQEKWINKAINQMTNNKRICFSVFFSGEVAGSSQPLHII